MQAQDLCGNACVDHMHWVVQSQLQTDMTGQKHVKGSL